MAIINSVITTLAFPLFLVSHKSNSHTELQVNVPPQELKVVAEIAEPEKVLIKVLENGTISIGETNYTLDKLEVKMHKLARQNKNQPILIQGDAKAKYQDVISVIDRCRKAGIFNISFATQKAKIDHSK